MKDPADLGDADLEYAALTRGAGLVDCADRTRVELTGDDRAGFLHNLCTNEIRKLPAGAGCEAFLLDPRGHILSHLMVFCRQDSIVLETVPGREQQLLAHLDRYLIRERVQLHGRSQSWSALLVAGRQSSRLLAQCLADLTPERLPAARCSHMEATIAGRPVFVARFDLVGPEGFMIFCDRADADEIRTQLTSRGAVPCGGRAFEMARIEAGFPLEGIDISDKNLPQEVARDAHTISFVKGCYIGQETVARIDALGHVNKTLVGVRFAGRQIPTRGTELKAGGQTVGQITSAEFSPQLNAPLAFAYVRRGNNRVGSVLDSLVGPAEVVDLPLAAQPEPPESSTF